VKEGDENTRFHHAHASQRLRKNHIKALEVQGVRFTSHVDKEQILSNHFTSLLGSPAATSWDFDVHGIYRDLPRVDSLPLITPFTVSEARAAIRAMNPISAPGPDGFGPGFYRSAWNLVMPSVMEFLDAFYDGVADLEHTNRAYVVLLPKTSDAVTPGAFRPISL